MKVTTENAPKSAIIAAPVFMVSSIAIFSNFHNIRPNRRSYLAFIVAVGIDEVHAELLPEDKLRKIEELVARYGTVAMVGDGVNGAPALARASLDVAMGAIGSDAAIETADIALMTDDISRLPWLVHHARRTLTIIREALSRQLGK
jgi:Cd2+/Zn2+-exporting ATPase